MFYYSIIYFEVMDSTNKDLQHAKNCNVVTPDQLSDLTTAIRTKLASQNLSTPSIDQNISNLNQKITRLGLQNQIPDLNQKILSVVFDEQIVAGNEPIEANKPHDDLRHEPYTLPEGFHWDTLNLNDPLVLKELYTLLNENYVEDEYNMFRFDYSPEFLRWALLPPGFLQEWHVGVRAKKSKKMVGFISAVPATISIYKKVVKLVEINFLCVHKKLRSKRLAPVLIREITRRVNCQGIFQAVYTAGVVLPKPVGTCR